jgi:hypothetical protein
MTWSPVSNLCDLWTTRAPFDLTVTASLLASQHLDVGTRCAVMIHCAIKPCSQDTR